MEKEKVLILAALPDGLRLDKEIREIEEAIKRAVKRDSFEIKIRTAVRSQDIRRALAEEKPQIVHFCGHGMENGSLVLEDDGGNHQSVSSEGLAALFKMHTNSVKCVLLNACYSEKSALAISQHINYTIGMNQPIGDRAAIVFAIGFYDGLGYTTPNNQDVFQRAFEEGKVAIQLEHLDEGQIPVLKTKTKEQLYKPMDVAILVKFLAPCLPFLINIGNKAVEGASQKLGEDVWTRAKAIWAKLQPKVEAKPSAQEALIDVVQTPNDEVALAALQQQLRKLLKEDPTLESEIGRLLMSAAQTESGRSIIQNISHVKYAATSGSGDASVSNITEHQTSQDN